MNLLLDDLLTLISGVQVASFASTCVFLSFFSGFCVLVCDLECGGMSDGIQVV